MKGRIMIQQAYGLILSGLVKFIIRILKGTFLVEWALFSLCLNLSQSSE